MKLYWGCIAAGVLPLAMLALCICLCFGLCCAHKEGCMLLMSCGPPTPNPLVVLYMKASQVWDVLEDRYSFGVNLYVDWCYPAAGTTGL